jgi:hypothetical protein
MTPRPDQLPALVLLLMALLVAACFYRPQRIPDTPALLAKAEAACFAAGGGSFTVTHHAGTVTGVECGP